MKTNPKHPTQNRGSVMLMVVVMLVLLTIIGMSYLQLARLDRMASNITTTKNIDIVSVATVAYISDVLKSDILNDSKDMVFDLGENKDELYDYPWTNDAASFKVVDQDGNLFAEQAYGGTLDDTWLASTEPVFTGGSQAYWPHITNLNGVFLKIPKLGGSVDFPDEEPVNNIDTTPALQKWRFDTHVPFLDSTTPNPTNTDYLSYTKATYDYEELGADADADGIRDSKWTWAPIRQISGVSYVMAVRIIDNSSLVNANVAMSLVNSSNTRDTTTNAPQWTTPSELDFGRFLYDMGGSGTELLKMLTYRLGVTTPALTDSLIPYLGSDTSRWSFWSNGPSMFGNFNANTVDYPTTNYRSYNSTDEMDLRYRNGLNSTKLTTTLGDAANGLSNFMRSTVNEAKYDLAGFTSMQAFFTIDPRHKMTVASGSSIYTSGVTKTPDKDFAVKRDLNVLLTSPFNLAYALYEIYGSHPILNGSYPSNIPTLPHGIADATELCKQASVNIIDYADADNQLTPYDKNDLDNTLYGMEALPALAEVYVQRPFDIDSTVQTPPGTDPTLWNLTTTSDTTHKTGYAIEIRNPFLKNIMLSDVYLYVKDIQFSDGDPKGDLASICTKHAKATILEPGQALILYKDSVGGNQDDINAMIDTSATPAPIVINISDSWPNSVGLSHENTTVELRATIADGSDVGTDPDELPWGYHKFSQISFPASDALVWNNCYSLSDPTGGKIYVQNSVLGSGDEINALIMGSGTQLKTLTNTNTDTSFVNFNSGIYALGKKDKTTIGGPASKINTTTNYDRQVYFSDAGGVNFVGEIFLVSVLGPNPTRDYATAWNNQTSLSVFRLPTTEVSPLRYYPIDHLTVMSPKEDGLDNDNDGTADNATELLIPGKININTANKEMLQSILPILSGTDRINLIDEMISYRDMTPLGSYETSATRASANKGIGSLHELYLMTQGANGGTTVYGYGATDVDILTKQQRFSNWMTNVASTRSDYFTAYVLIKGYIAGDFSLGAVESKQFFVIFDRSQIASGSGQVRIIGYYEFD